MSQEKVDYRKELKANRGHGGRNPKSSSGTLGLVLAIAIIAGMVVWIAISAATRNESSTGSNRKPVDISAVENYINNMDAPVVEDTADTDNNDAVVMEGTDGDLTYEFIPYDGAAEP